MVKSELIKRSPLRELEKTIGSLGAGKICVIAGEKGLGKTACLVHIATDKLFQGKHVIHVSYSRKVDHIISWYEDIFSEIAKKRDLENAMDIHDELIHNRVIMNFNQKGMSVEQVINSIKAMMDYGLKDTSAIIVDGFSFVQSSPEELEAFKKLAEDKEVELWFSDSYERAADFTDERGYPRNLITYDSLVNVVITMRAETEGTKLTLVKHEGEVSSEDTHIMLDSKTLLLLKEQ